MAGRTLTKGEMTGPVTPDVMGRLGLELYDREGEIYRYRNDGKVHRNVDYNPRYPESRGKVLVHLLMDNGPYPFVMIEQDGGTRTVYHGVVRSIGFLDELLDSIR